MSALGFQEFKAGYLQAAQNRDIGTLQALIGARVAGSPTEMTEVAQLKGSIITAIRQSGAAHPSGGHSSGGRGNGLRSAASQSPSGASSPLRQAASPAILTSSRVQPTGSGTVTRLANSPTGALNEEKAWKTAESIADNLGACVVIGNIGYLLVFGGVAPLVNIAAITIAENSKLISSPRRRKLAAGAMILGGYAISGGFPPLLSVGVITKEKVKEMIHYLGQRRTIQEEGKVRQAWELAKEIFGEKGVYSVIGGAAYGIYNRDLLSPVGLAIMASKDSARIPVDYKLITAAGCLGYSTFFGGIGSLLPLAALIGGNPEITLKGKARKEDQTTINQVWEIARRVFGDIGAYAVIASLGYGIVFGDLSPFANTVIIASSGSSKIPVALKAAAAAGNLGYSLIYGGVSTSLVTMSSVLSKNTENIFVKLGWKLSKKEREDVQRRLGVAMQEEIIAILERVQAGIHGNVDPQVAQRAMQAADKRLGEQILKGDEGINVRQAIQQAKDAATLEQANAAIARVRTAVRALNNPAPAI